MVARTAAVCRFNCRNNAFVFTSKTFTYPSLSPATNNLPSLRNRPEKQSSVNREYDRCTLSDSESYNMTFVLAVTTYESDDTGLK